MILLVNLKQIGFFKGFQAVVQDPSHNEVGPTTNVIKFILQPRLQPTINYSISKLGITISIQNGFISLILGSTWL